MGFLEIEAHFCSFVPSDENLAITLASPSNCSLKNEVCMEPEEVRRIVSEIIFRDLRLTNSPSPRREYLLGKLSERFPEEPAHWWAISVVEFHCSVGKSVYGIISIRGVGVRDWKEYEEFRNIVEMCFAPLQTKQLALEYAKFHWERIQRLIQPGEPG